MGDLNEAFREKLNDAGYQMRRSVTAFLAVAQKKGEIPVSMNIKEASSFILMSWNGALMQMKVMKSLAPLRIFDRAVFDIFLAKGDL